MSDRQGIYYGAVNPNDLKGTSGSGNSGNYAVQAGIRAGNINVSDHIEKTYWNCRNRVKLLKKTMLNCLNV